MRHQVVTLEILSKPYELKVGYVIYWNSPNSGSTVFSDPTDKLAKATNVILWQEIHCRSFHLSGDFSWFCFSKV